MSRMELSRTLGSIAAVLVSYAAAFWLLTLSRQGFNTLGRIGWLSAVYCAMGVGVFFWAKILAPVAKKRFWSQRGCQYAALMVMIPGCILFVARPSILHTGNLLILQSLFTGLLLTKFVYPNFYKSGPFDREPAITPFPK
jgi:hypothetical protein